MKIQHILYPTDLSEESMRPAAAIGALAQRENARLTLLNVVPVFAAVPHGAPFAPLVVEPDAAGRHAAAEDRLREKMSALPQEIDVQVAVVEAPFAADAIAEYLENSDVDLVAMATHGRSGLRRLGLGSVCEGVLRRAHVPILAFPPAQGS